MEKEENVIRTEYRIKAKNERNKRKKYNVKIRK